MINIVDNNNNFNKAPILTENTHPVSMQDDSIAESHVIKDISLGFDPYGGNIIEEIRFILDDGSVWAFRISYYRRNHLFLERGDEVQTSFLKDDQYVMVIPAKDGEPEKSIPFEKYTCLASLDYYSPY